MNSLSFAQKTTMVLAYSLCLLLMAVMVVQPKLTSSKHEHVAELVPVIVAAKVYVRQETLPAYRSLNPLTQVPPPSDAYGRYQVLLVAHQDRRLSHFYEVDSTTYNSFPPLGAHLVMTDLSNVHYLRGVYRLQYDNAPRDRRVWTCVDLQQQQ